MMRRSAWWLSLCLTTCAWILWLPLYYRLPVMWGAGCLMGAALAAGLAFVQDSDTGKVSRSTVFTVLAACVIAFPFFTWGFRISLILIAAGVLSASISKPRLVRFGLGTSAIGMCSLLQGTAAAAYTGLIALYHSAAPIAFIDYWLARLLGMDVTTMGNLIYLPTGTTHVPIAVSWDQFGLPFALLVVVGLLFGVLLASETDRKWARMVRLLGITMMYLIARHFLLLLVAVELARPQVFWDPLVSVGSFVPFFGVLVLCWRRLAAPTLTDLSRFFRPSKKGLIVATFALVGALSAGLAISLAPPGRGSTNCIAFDEAHGDWESTLRPLDTVWYGMQSTYNYYSLYRWLSYYYDVRQLREPFDEETLRNCDVLVLKIPSVPFAEEEIEAIASHVRSGGGLFVVGDHTNVFGSTSALNPVLARFGIALNYDATYDLYTGGFTVYESSPMFRDPITQHIERFEFLTSCSLDAPLGAFPTIRDTAVLANQADYATRDFFSPTRFSLSSTFGAFTQAAVVDYGSGRVVAFTDSTCFSGFSVFMDGYPEFILATIGLLGRGSPAFPYRVLLLGVLGFCAIGCGWLGITGERRPFFMLLLIGGIIGWTLASILASSLHRAWYPLPEPREPIPYVYFDLGHSQVRVNPQPDPLGKTDEGVSFDTFFVWTQRVDRVPVITNGVDQESMVHGRPYVLINPPETLSESFLERLEVYVRSDGGNLLLMGRREDLRGVRRVLGRFDLQLSADSAHHRTLAEAEVHEREISPALTLYVSVAQCGSGKVVFVDDSVPFSDLSLGGTFTVPSDVQRTLYDTEFWLLEEVLD